MKGPPGPGRSEEALAEGVASALPRGRVHRARPEAEPDDRAGLRERDRERPERIADEAALEPFRALPVLQPLAESARAATPGSAMERAQAAALAERLLHSVRVGKVAGGHEVRLRLAASGVEVRLRHVAGQLTPELHLPPGATARDAAAAEGLAARLDAELRAAGVEFDAVDVVG